MRYSFTILTSALVLVACSTTPEQASVCSGNTMKGCQPVVYFDTGSDVLKKDQLQTLNWAADKMKRWPRKHVKITGHTDSVGEADKNLVLSKNRAIAVKNYLINKGIDSERIVTDFKGESNRVCTNTSCVHLNRRAELQLSAPNGGWEPINWDKVSAKFNDVKCFLCEEE